MKYVRSWGNDLTGDGSFANPYKTLMRALQDNDQDIDIGSGYYVEVLADPLWGRDNFRVVGHGDAVIQLHIWDIAEPKWIFFQNINVRVVDASYVGDMKHYPVMFDSCNVSIEVNISPNDRVLWLCHRNLQIGDLYSGNSFFVSCKITAKNHYKFLHSDTLFLYGNEWDSHIKTNVNFIFPELKFFARERIKNNSERDYAINGNVNWWEADLFPIDMDSLNKYHAPIDVNEKEWQFLALGRYSALEGLVTAGDYKGVFGERRENEEVYTYFSKYINILKDSAKNTLTKIFSLGIWDAETNRLLPLNDKRDRLIAQWLYTTVFHTASALFSIWGTFFAYRKNMALIDYPYFSALKMNQRGFEVKWGRVFWHESWWRRFVYGDYKYSYNGYRHLKRVDGELDSVLLWDGWYLVYVRVREQSLSLHVDSYSDFESAWNGLLEKWMSFDVIPLSIFKYNANKVKSIKNFINGTVGNRDVYDAVEGQYYDVGDILLYNDKAALVIKDGFLGDPSLLSAPLGAVVDVGEVRVKIIELDMLVGDNGVYNPTWKRNMVLLSMQDNDYSLRKGLKDMKNAAFETKKIFLTENQKENLWQKRKYFEKSSIVFEPLTSHRYRLLKNGKLGNISALINKPEEAVVYPGNHLYEYGHGFSFKKEGFFVVIKPGQLDFYSDDYVEYFEQRSIGEIFQVEDLVIIKVDNLYRKRGVANLLNREPNTIFWEGDVVFNLEDPKYWYIALTSGKTSANPNSTIFANPDDITIQDGDITWQNIGNINTYQDFLFVELVDMSIEERWL